MDVLISVLQHEIICYYRNICGKVCLQGISGEFGPLHYVIMNSCLSYSTNYWQGKMFVSGTCIHSEESYFSTLIVLNRQVA